MYRNVPVVPRLMYGRGSFSSLDGILESARGEAGRPVTFVVDGFFESADGKGLRDRLPDRQSDTVIFADIGREPSTDYVDDLTSRIGASAMPCAVVGIGGGSTLDIAKAMSLMLTNEGPSAAYQGWDLIKRPAVYHVGIPTLSGSGSEASRTAVLIGPERKLGLNSDHTVFDQVLLDPELIATVPGEQRFFTGMDCFIHAVEALNGTFRNSFSDALGNQAKTLCEEVFLRGGEDRDDKLMTASYLGGLSIGYSQVGICHALSYGLAYALGTRHGLGNCIVFDKLEEFFPSEVGTFKRMAEANRIKLPRIMAGNHDRIEKMIDVALTMAPLWENSFGADWREVATRAKLRSIYELL